MKKKVEEEVARECFMVSDEGGKEIVKKAKWKGKMER